VEKRPGKGLVDEVRVVKGVVAIGLVVVGCAVKGESDWINRASQRAVTGMIELLVIGKVGTIRGHQPAEKTGWIGRK
jgi:hypothetical protein